MSGAKQEINVPKKARTLEEEITAQREKLKKLEDRQRDLQRKEREKNQKNVFELIKAEKLDSVSADLWRKVMPSIKKALLIDESDSTKSSPNEKKTALEISSVKAVA